MVRGGRNTPDGTPSGTYVGMMQHNFRTIAEALGGSVPAEFTSAGTVLSADESRHDRSLEYDPTVAGKGAQR